MQSVKYEPGEIVPGSVYRVVRHLASGGMGTVYEVEDTSVEKRYVLKTLHPQLVAREELARRMRDEAKSLARLQHPNVVDVITAGVTTDRTRLPYYVMERLVGQNLRVVLKKKRVLEPGPALRIAIDVLDALEHAHENQIVHRDVKPENIFLHRNANGTTTTKLLDFGIVRLLDRDGGQTTGKFIGTLRYASPEQITGRAIGPATDVYSLALVLYEMLVGRGPFDDVGDGYAIGTAHAGRPPPPPSSFGPIDRDIEQLVMSALAKDPAERPRDCFTFATELRRSLRLRGEDGAARSSTPTEANLVSPESNGQAFTDAGMPPPTPPVASAGNDTGPVSPVAPTVAAEMEPGATPPRREIDREAPTRTSAPLGGTQRIPSNDTRMEEIAAAPPRAEERGLRPSDPGEGSWPSPTGPIAGEAATRPPAPPARLAAIVAGGVLVLAAGTALAVRYRPAVAVAPAPAAISAAPPEPAPSASQAAEAKVEAPPESAASATAAPRPSPAAAVRPTSGKPVASAAAVSAPVTTAPARRGAPSARAPEIKFDP